jgi:hypothetical protein
MGSKNVQRIHVAEDTLYWWGEHSNEPSGSI